MSTNCLGATPLWSCSWLTILNYTLPLMIFGKSLSTSMVTTTNLSLNSEKRICTNNVIMQVTAFCDVTSYTLVDMYRYFSLTYSIFWLWEWRQQGIPKHRYMATRTGGVPPQKIITFVVRLTVMRTSKLTKYFHDFGRVINISNRCRGLLEKHHILVSNSWGLVSGHRVSTWKHGMFSPSRPRSVFPASQ